jgi:hypothetical protein
MIYLPKFLDEHTVSIANGEKPVVHKADTATARKELGEVSWRIIAKSLI